MAEDDIRYRAVQARDPRFDGWFFVAVTSTGIYCRPSCASVLPGRANVRFYPTAAAAQKAGFRACKRCRPDASPGSPEWDRRDDVVARAMRAIADGVVDREGVHGLASRLGYSTRQLGRLLLAEVGAGPLELARAQRAQTARILLETTSMPAYDVAFAAGFGSVRQFNDTVRAVFAEAPTALRARAQATAQARGRVSRPARSAARDGATGGTGDGAAAPGATAVTVRLAFRPPMVADLLFGFLAARAVPGVEEGDLSSYKRSLSLPHGLATVTVRPPAGGERYMPATFVLEDLRDLTTAVKRARQLFDLDADPEAVSELLGGDPLLGEAVRSRPGVRVPGHVDGDELAIRAVLGQQVSVAGARTLAGRLAAAYGRPLSSPDGTVVRSFPPADALAEVGTADLAMPRARARCLTELAGALAKGEVDLSPGADREKASEALQRLPGIGPWTVSYIQMRALRDPDAFPAADLGLRRALERAGVPGARSPAAVLSLSRRWRPYRAYALQYLWAGLPEAQGAGRGRRARLARAASPGGRQMPAATIEEVMA
ncbi:MAG TPA: AlkA N-terminal domain-containing protein [Acidimicrobiales bacterium]|nr:AlkA N-terminal domain-containing protein [Acidimicrobiales bacterium]